MIVDKNDLSKVRIIDFGFSKRLLDGCDQSAEAMHTICGTPLYISPEMLSGFGDEKGNISKYGTEVDIWACGVILYALLSGCTPFTTANKASILELFDDIRGGHFNFDDPCWEMVSPQATDLIEGMLTVDPAARLTAEEALKHPWLQNKWKNT